MSMILFAGGMIVFLHVDVDGMYISILFPQRLPATLFEICIVYFPDFLF